MKHAGRGLFLALTWLATNVVHAADFYQGVRQMGMGGAAVAVVNDETSLLLNPNGLGRLRVPYVTIIDPEVTTNSDSVGLVQDLGMGAMNVEDVYNGLAGRLDEPYFFRGQVFPSYVDRNFGFGLFGRTEMSARRSSLSNVMALDYKSDMAAVGGYNHSFFSGQVKLGVTARLIDRVAYRGDVDPAVQGLDIKTIATEGLGLAGDVGVSFSAPITLLPTLSILAKDVGDTSFTLGDGMRDYSTLTPPDKIPMAVDIAVAIFPIWTKWTRGTFTIEYDDATEKGDAERKLHLGGEVNLGDRFFLRGGWNRGYPTAGLEWAGSFFQLQIAYYGEEIGTDENPVKDERVTLKTVIRF